MLSQATVRVAVPLAAASRFKGFTPSTEGVQPVRQPLVTGDELQELHRRREMLRNMTPEQAYHVIDWHTGLTFTQAVALAKATGKLMVPNSVIDRILNETDLRIPYVQTGTLIIYEKPGKLFGDIIFYRGIEFLVPVQFRGKTNCALVVQYPDFDVLPSGNNHQLVVLDENNLHLVEAFPIKDGWYEPDCEFGIPYGVVKEHSEGTRHLWRRDSSYIGSLARDVGDYNGRWRYVFAGSVWSYVSGVALF